MNLDSVKKLVDKEWTFDFADVELEGNVFIVNSEIDYKDIVKMHENLVQELGEDSINAIKDLFTRNRLRETEVDDETKNELITFFNKIMDWNY